MENLALNQETQEQNDLPIPITQTLYVSSSLNHFLDTTVLTTQEEQNLYRDIYFQKETYRRLDGEYYAWLYTGMENLALAHKNNKIDRDTYRDMRDKFASIHSWAVTNIGIDKLNAGLRKNRRQGYDPPQEIDNKKQGTSIVSPYPIPLKEIIGLI